MNNHEAHYYLEELQRMMTQHRGIFSEEFVHANGMAILALEPKTGKWLTEGHTTHYNVCSLCGGVGDTTMKYCPNCGADMRGA